MSRVERDKIFLHTSYEGAYINEGIVVRGQLSIFLNVWCFVFIKMFIFVIFIRKVHNLQMENINLKNNFYSVIFLIMR